MKLPSIENTSLAQAINEDVELHRYDPSWPSLFEMERDYLLSLPQNNIIDIQHFGSTAVPGLAAKPIIDILIGVASLTEADSLVARLCQITGYTTSVEFNATLSDRRWLMKYANGRRTHHLHVVEHGGKQWCWRLKFREALRDDERLAKNYAEHKRILAMQFANDREAYTVAKKEFIVAAIGDLDL